MTSSPSPCTPTKCGDYKPPMDSSKKGKKKYLRFVCFHVDYTIVLSWFVSELQYLEKMDLLEPADFLFYRGGLAERLHKLIRLENSNRSLWLHKTQRSETDKGNGKMFLSYETHTVTR